MPLPFPRARPGLQPRIADSPSCAHAQVDDFFASDYPELPTLEIIEVNGSEHSCMVGQAFPRGFELTSKCVFNQIPNYFDVGVLPFFNMQARTCDTDLCNDDCNKIGAWWDGRQVNIGLFLILGAFAVTGVGALICLVARATDKGSAATDALRETVVEGGALATTTTTTTTTSKADAAAAAAADAAAKEKKPKEPAASFSEVLSEASALEKLLYALGCACACATGMGMPLMSLMFGRNLGGLASENESMYETMQPLVLQLVAIGAGSIVVGSMMYALLENVGASVAQKWGEKYLRAVLRQDVAWFDVGNQAGSLLSAMTVDTRAVAKGLGIQVGLFLMHMTEMVGAVVLAFSWAGYWDVALVCLSGVPLMAIASGVMLSSNEKLTKREGVAYAEAGAIAAEAIAAMRTVQALNAQPGIRDRFAAALAPAQAASIVKAVGNGSSLGMLNGASMLMYLFATLYVGQKLVDDYSSTNCHLHDFNETVYALGGPGEQFAACKLNVGDVLATLFNIVFGGMAAGQCADPLAKMGAARTAVRKIQLTVQRVPAIDVSSDAGEKPEGLAGTVELKDVRFCYPARPDSVVANGLTLTIGAGQTVALVGRSGGGKSTVMALVQRFYDPASGAVSLDGHDLRTLNVRHLRSKIGLVGQEPVLFSGSIAQNIAYGAPGHAADDARIEEAARLAHAHDFISKLERGYETDVGAGGGKISGGQKQRVAIARAIIRNPVLLLLDEATSALDNESERIVQAALDDIIARRKRTTVTIAHRLTTIRNANKIVVLKKGAVVETGCHDELLKLGGVTATCGRHSSDDGWC